MKRYRYLTTYTWGEPDLLNALIEDCEIKMHGILDVACGPNRIVEIATKCIKSSSLYIALDIRPEPIILKRNESKIVQGVVADALFMPFISESYDIVFYHHAIDDIVETRGKGSIPDLIAEGERVVRSGGALVFSHSIIAGDRSTKIVGLDDVKKELDYRGEIKQIRGTFQSWLIFKKP
ncbi:MAG: class I SAM-dependent methyltransferase [Thermoproteota archaeon]